MAIVFSFSVCALVLQINIHFSFLEDIRNELISKIKNYREVLEEAERGLDTTDSDDLDSILSSPVLSAANAQRGQSDVPMGRISHDDKDGDNGKGSETEVERDREHSSTSARSVEHSRSTSTSASMSTSTSRSVYKQENSVTWTRTPFACDDGGSLLWRVKFDLEDRVAHDVFDAAREEVYELMAKDSYRRFLRAKRKRLLKSGKGSTTTVAVVHSVVDKV